MENRHELHNAKAAVAQLDEVARVGKGAIAKLEETRSNIKNLIKKCLCVAAFLCGIAYTQFRGGEWDNIMVSLGLLCIAYVVFILRMFKTYRTVCNELDKRKSALFHVLWSANYSRFLCEIMEIAEEGVPTYGEPEEEFSEDDFKSPEED